MRTWEDYKKTFPEESIFDWARSGDLPTFYNAYKSGRVNDLNEKNSKGYSALMLAVYNGQDVFAEALLRLGADPNSHDFAGNSVLMGASYKGNVELVKMLVSYGAKIDIKNESGMSAYDWAKTFNRNDVMKLLVSFGHNENDSQSKIKNYFNLCMLGMKKVF